MIFLGLGHIQTAMGANHRPGYVAPYEFETATGKIATAIVLVLLVLAIYWNLRPGIMMWRARRTGIGSKTYKRAKKSIMLTRTMNRKEAKTASEQNND